jgi:hypothetical protein
MKTTKEYCTQDKLSITEWAERIYKEQIETVKTYIAEGIDKVSAVKMVLENSTLGRAYKAQLRYEFDLGIFD